MTCVYFISSGQNRLVKDLDNDNINDTVYIDAISSKIVCRLSTQQFVKMQSKAIEELNEQSGIVTTKNGFEFYNNWMRAGYRNQFRFSAKEKKIQLIGMSRYELGNAANDGSGESSVNLLTNDYVGNWNFYHEKKEALIAIPTIKTKLILPKTHLESFSEETFFGYAGKCSALFAKRKDELLKSK
ncbi:MAG: hypothetical protein V4722_15350 [Bacteroidota bacterium]